MKVFLLSPNENWVVDRFVSEWKLDHSNSDEFETVETPKSADLVYLIADWCWRQVDPQALSKKKVIASVHHIVPEKFGDAAKKDFEQRDEFVDAYHVPCELTKKQIEPLTNKPIYCFPFWINDRIWSPKDRGDLRKQYGISQNAFLVGSFQRDTEGHDLKSPKLEKGPDVFCDFVEGLANLHQNVEVLLGGWRRQYVQGRLDKAGIKYHYSELPSFSRLNDFYNMLDLYVVGSRYEGGPQAVFECSATRTPILSSHVGYAPELLHEKCLFGGGGNPNIVSSEEVLDYNFKNVEKFFIPNGFKQFEDMFREVVK
jgi:glycosyltransferase involved in cell wall biosynthesis